MGGNKARRAGGGERTSPQTDSARKRDGTKRRGAASRRVESRNRQVIGLAPSTKMLSPLRSLPRLTLPRSTSRHLSTSPTALRPRSSVPSAKRPTPPPSPQPPPTPAPTSSSPRQPSHPRPWERPEPPFVAAARGKSVKQRNVWESYLGAQGRARGDKKLDGGANGAPLCVQCWTRSFGYTSASAWGCSLSSGCMPGTG